MLWEVVLIQTLRKEWGGFDLNCLGFLFKEMKGAVEKDLVAPFGLF